MEGWKCRSAAERLPGKHKALGLVSGTERHEVNQQAFFNEMVNKKAPGDQCGMLLRT